MSKIDTERLAAEMLAGLDGVTPGLWFVGAQNDGLYIIDAEPSPAPYDGPVPRGYGPNVIATPNFRLPNYRAGAAHIARCSPDNIRALLTERAADKARIAELEIENKRLREALGFYCSDYLSPSDGPWGINSTDFGNVARKALGGDDAT